VRSVEILSTSVVVLSWIATPKPVTGPSTVRDEEDMELDVGATGTRSSEDEPSRRPPNTDVRESTSFQAPVLVSSLERKRPKGRPRLDKSEPFYQDISQEGRVPTRGKANPSRKEGIPSNPK